MEVLLISEQLLISLLKDVREAQKKLYNAHCSRQLIKELDWDIRMIEFTTYEHPEYLLDRFKAQYLEQRVQEDPAPEDPAPWEE